MSAPADDGLARVEAALAARFPSRMVPDLDRIVDLLDLLGSPQRANPAVHITGTNGKTSTARMIDALLRAHDLRTGRYTSPHLTSVTERIAVDGRPLSADRFTATYDEVAPLAALVDARHEERVTFFELLTAMAFAAFADTPVDVSVVEVGLGGRWDATNVLGAPVAVVTPIGLDHRELLGDTVAAIAGEKAGIVHEGAVLVTAQQPVEAAEVLLRRAAAIGATVAREGLEFGVVERGVAVGGQLLTLRGLGGDYPEVFLPLYGRHQAGNAATALAAAEAFLGATANSPLDLETVQTAFAQVDSPGRLEIVRTNPTVLIDAAHNPAGARALAAALEESFQFRRLVAVLAVLDDKDALGMIAALDPVVDEVVLTRNSSPRALAPDALAEIALDVLDDDRVEVVERFDDALQRAVDLAEAGGKAGGGVLVTGSVVTAGDARRLLRVSD